MEKKDYGDKKTELLVKVARMYYEDSEGCRGDRVRHALWGNHADDGAWFRYG